MKVFTKNISSITLIIIIAFFSSCSRSESDTVSSNLSSSSTDIPSDAIGTQFVVDTQPVIDTSDIVWIVEPTLEYNEVYYCWLCGYTANSFTYIIDESTGQITGFHDGHGGPYFQTWLYDSESGIFALYRYGWDQEITIHPINDFSIHFLSYVNNLNYVKQVDVNKIIKIEVEDWEYSYNLGTKYENSKYAISYGSVLLTDFIYDNPDNLSDSLIYKNAIPVSINGKWGFINKSGNLIIPFIFDHAASSDGETAFVKINGKYGIIDVRGSDDN